MVEPTLAARVHSLPAELFNQIQDFVFTVDAPSTTISEDYKPPAQLQVSRATRKRFASEFYSSTTFVFLESRQPLFAAWLASLPTIHRRSISRIHMDRPNRWRTFRSIRAQTVELMRAILKHGLHSKGLDCEGGEALKPQTLLSTNVMVMEESSQTLSEKMECVRFGY